MQADQRALHRVADRLIRRWRLTLEVPIIDTPSGCVAFATTAGTPVVVKVPRPDDDEAEAAAVLRHWDGCGAVRLLDTADGGMLLERLLPGTPLAGLVRAGHDDEATAVLCDVAAALHRPPPTVAGFARVEELGSGFARYRRSGDRMLDAAQVDAAEAVFIEQAQTQGERRLLHGDLQHYNVLRDDARGWLAIDPKGVLGESAYEMGALLRNPIEDPRLYAAPAIVSRRVSIIVERLGVDRARVLRWGFAQAVLSAIWSIEAGDDPAVDLALADYCLSA